MTEKKKKPPVPVGESGFYPDSGKWKVNRTSQADRVVIKGKETDYFDGEE